MRRGNTVDSPHVKVGHGRKGSVGQEGIGSIDCPTVRKAQHLLVAQHHTTAVTGRRKGVGRGRDAICQTVKGEMRGVGKGVIVEREDVIFRSRPIGGVYAQRAVRLAECPPKRLFPVVEGQVPKGGIVGSNSPLQPQSVLMGTCEQPAIRRVDKPEVSGFIALQQPQVVLMVHLDFHCQAVDLHEPKSLQLPIAVQTVGHEHASPNCRFAHQDIIPTVHQLVHRTDTPENGGQRWGNSLGRQGTRKEKLQEKSPKQELHGPQKP